MLIINKLELVDLTNDRQWTINELMDHACHIEIDRNTSSLNDQYMHIPKEKEKKDANPWTHFQEPNVLNNGINKY